MKHLIFLLLITGCIEQQATTQKRYISSSGSDGNAGTIAAPWKTVAKASSSSAAGDSIFFNRGDEFYGTFSAKANQKIGAYGTGDKPRITGYTTLSSWTDAGGGVYYATFTGDSMLSNVSMDGKLMQIARYPNEDEYEMGYLDYWTTDSNTATKKCSPTKIRHTIAGNWTGTQMRIKTDDWTLENVLVTSDKNDTLTFKDYFFLDVGGHPPLAACKWGFGYFFVNKLSFLDKPDEYFYDRPNNRLYVYFGSEVPGDHNVQASTQNQIFYIGQMVGVDIKDLEIEGGNYYGIKVNHTSTTEILRNDIHNVGAYPIGGYRMNNSIIRLNTIYSAHGGGIYLQSPSSPYPNINIWENTIYDIGLEAGMYNFNQSGNGSGIYCVFNTGVSILRNKITNVGRDGIMWNGSNVEIAYNDIETYCVTLQDHGGIYSYWDMNQYLVFKNRRIHHNYVKRGVGAPQGTASSRRRASAIYMDGYNKNILIDHNSAEGYPNKFVTCNCDSSITIRDNKMLAMDSSGHDRSYSIGLQRQRAVQYYNLVIANNVMYSFIPSQATMYITVSGLSSGQSPQSSIRGWGRIDSNYVNMVNKDMYKLEYYNGKYNEDFMTFEQWKTYSLYDAHTQVMPDFGKDSVKMFKNRSDAPANVPIPGTWRDENGVQYSNSINLAAWDSKIMTLVSGSSPSSMSVSFVDTMVTCFGFSNGKSYPTVFGGTLPISYSWSNGATTKDLVNVPAGLYTFTATDASFTVVTGTRNITQPTQLIGNATWGSVAPGGTTTVVVTAVGGTPPYTGTGTFTGVAQGSYIYTVSDFNGCTTGVPVIVVKSGEYIKLNNVQIIQRH